MIKKTSLYIIVIMMAVITGYILSITYNNLSNIYTKVKQNNKKINFLQNINDKNNAPMFCFQSAYKLSENTNTPLPEIYPLGAIPFKSKNNLVNFDRYGFRNNNNVWDNKNHDYLILGDSVVVDDSISDKNIFSNNFQNKNVINLGCGGNGLLTSLSLLEQVLLAKYKFSNVFFFINFDNDFSKDTMREFYSKVYLGSIDKKKNIFLNQEKYELEFLDFVKTAFSKEVLDFSIKDEFYKEIKKNSFIKKLSKDKKSKIADKVRLEDGQVVDADIIPEGAHGKKMYKVFLNILERISILKKQNNLDISFILIPTNNEINIYKSNKQTEKQWEKYLNYKYLKNTIASTAANFDINIIDLYDFIRENNYKGFPNGHFEKDYHEPLSYFIVKRINNNTEEQLKKLYYYNSFYPSKMYFNYQVNFGNTLSNAQVKDWINIINELIKKNIIDNYLLSPALAYFFINQDCKSILDLHEKSNADVTKYNVGNFFYKVCELKYTQDISKSIKEINLLIDNQIKYYVPGISSEIKKSLKLIHENK